MNTCIYHAHIHTACCSRPPFPLMHQHLSTKQHTPPNGHRRSSMRPRLVPRTCGLHDLHRQTHTSTHTHTRTYTHRGNDVSNKHQGRSYTTAAVLWTRTKTKHTRTHTNKIHAQMQQQKQRQQHRTWLPDAFHLPIHGFHLSVGGEGATASDTTVF